MLAAFKPQSAIPAFAPNADISQRSDLSRFLPIPVWWTNDLQEMIRTVRSINPVSMIIVGDGDNVSTMHACYECRHASSAPLHVITKSMSETEADFTRFLGATTVNDPEAAPGVIAQSIWQTFGQVPTADDIDPVKEIEIADVKIDLGRRTVSVDGVAVRLTRIEFELFVLLVKSAGSVVPRTDLVARVWGANWFGAENVLDTHLAHLRRKFAANGLVRAFVNVRGVGYYFEPTESFRSISGATV
jgi:two-component system, OmpR family, response regulator RegX3